MFKRLVAIYRDFAVDGRRGGELVREMMRLSTDLDIRDPKFEEAILKAFRTEAMVDVEIAKEIFHSRLKVLDKALLGGVDPFLIFKGIPGRRHGECGLNVGEN